MTSHDPASTLGEFELFVMLAVLHEGEEGYSRTIRRAIEERSGRSVSRGALYVTLDRLTGKGLLESSRGKPRPERGGKARRHYSVTPEGLRAVRASRSTLERMWEGLDDVLAGA